MFFHKHMTDDHGIRDMLSFLLARDTLHQNQWLAAARELQESKMEELPVPDGKGEFTYHDGPTTSAPMPPATHPDARFYGTTEIPNTVEKMAGTLQDKLNRE